MIVIDASTALKWILSLEEYSDKALKLYKDHIENRKEILVPSLIFIEIANTLVTKSDLTKTEVKMGLKFIYAANLKSHETSEKEILEASTLAKKYKTTVYDMLYAVIAKNKNCELITADENFIKKTGFKFVKHISEI